MEDKTWIRLVAYRAVIYPPAIRQQGADLYIVRLHFAIRGCEELSQVIVSPKMHRII